MLNMKKILIAGTVMTALCATAFAASNDQADKPTMRERVNRILCENRNDCPAPADCQGPRQQHRDWHKMSPEKRAEIEKQRAEWKKMTPEQRQAIRANRPLKMHDGKHFKHHKDGKHFQGEGFRGHGPRPDCSPAICPPAPAK